MKPVTSKMSLFGAVVPQRALRKRAGAKLQKMHNMLTHEHKKWVNGNTFVITARFYEFETIEGKTYYVIMRRAAEVLHLRNVLRIKNCMPGMLIKDKRPTWSSGIQMLPNQKLMFDTLMSDRLSDKNIEAGFGTAIVQMDTGQGKTFLAIKIAGHFGKRTLVIVPNSTNADDWEDVVSNPELTTSLHDPSRSAPATYMRWPRDRKKRDIMKVDIVIMIINTARKDEIAGMHWAEFYASFHTILLDEGPAFVSDKNRVALKRATAPVTLAFTADPEEGQTGMNVILKRVCGPVINAAKLPGYLKTDIKFEGTVEAVQYYGTPKYSNDIKNVAGYNSAGGTIKHIRLDENRNEMILQYVEQVYQEGKNVFVFVEHRPHVLDLEARFMDMHPELVGEAAECILTLMGGDKREKLKLAKKKARVIFITYGFGWRGMSMPRMDALVLGTPRRNALLQVTGRILRASGDPSSIRRIIDIIDMRNHLSRQFTARNKVYKERGFKVTKVKRVYDEFEVKAKVPKKLKIQVP